MTPAIQNFVQRMNNKYNLRTFRNGERFVTQVIEFGSRDVNGGVRQFFAGANYTGVDMEAGLGVDRVANAEEWDGSQYDVVICCEMLEHTKRFWLALETLRHSVRPGGYLLITTPDFGFPLHRHPRDYWRFGEDAYREVFFDGFELLELEKVTDTAGFHGWAALGRKPL